MTPFREQKEGATEKEDEANRNISETLDDDQEYQTVEPIDHSDKTTQYMAAAIGNVFHFLFIYNVILL